MNKESFNGLDPRLRTAADMVRNGAVVADIGTDHGHLIIGLVSSGKCPRGYACDVAPGPLSSAEVNIQAAGLSDKIEILLGNGLERLDDKKIDDIIILGMGGDLIAEILSGRDWVKDENLRFILQPMTKAERLHRFLCSSGFEIIAERAVVSGRFVYNVISARYSGDVREADDLFAWTGLVWNNNDNTSRLYLERVLKAVEKKAEGLHASGKNREADRYTRLAETIRERIG